jgi:hypothetical protein
LHEAGSKSRFSKTYLGTITTTLLSLLEFSQYCIDLDLFTAKPNTLRSLFEGFSRLEPIKATTGFTVNGAQSLYKGPRLDEEQML